MNEVIPNAWRARTGSIPFYDLNMVDSEVKKINEPVILHAYDLERYLMNGVITNEALIISKYLLKYKCLPEKQIRYLMRHYFEREALVGTLLRKMFRLAWFDNIVIKNSEDDTKETFWFLGKSACFYFSQVEKNAKITLPMTFLKKPSRVLSTSGVNQMLLWFDERDLLLECDVRIVWPTGSPVEPFASAVVDSKHGPITMHIERLMQMGRPVKMMTTKLMMYETMMKNNGSLSHRKFPLSPSVVVWSVGSFEALQNIVESQEYVVEGLQQWFVVDEVMEEFPRAFYIAETGKRGEVTITQLDMDLF